MATLAREALENDAGRALIERGSVGTAAEQPALVADALNAYVKTLGGEALRDRVDAAALPEILHALAGGAFDGFRSALETIVAAVEGSSLMGNCDPRTAVKSLARMRAKVQEYRAEQGQQRWPACARVQDPLRATVLCSSAAVMLQALRHLEAPPFELLRLKNNLASEEKPFNLLAVLEFAPRDAEVPLVVEVQLLFDHLLPLFAHTHVLYSVYRARSFGSRNAATSTSGVAGKREPPRRVVDIEALVDDSEDDDPVTVVVGGVDDAAAGDGVECGACGLFEQAVVDAPAHFPDTDEPRLQV